MNTRGTLVAAALSLTLVAAAGPASTATAAPAQDSATAYIIKTKSVSAAGGVARDVEAAGGQIKNVYQRVYPGFSANLTTAQVQELTANPKVVSVIADQAVHSTTTQLDPTWGLDRIDQRPTAGDGRYSYDTTGTGVTAYVVDTGIRLTHNQFGTRAVSGHDFVDNDTDASDCNGHGTHVSGTVGGSTYGVAKAVTLVGVRVLDCDGSGTGEDVIAGIDWATADHSGPSVRNMSLAGGGFTPIDDAVAAATLAGVTVVVAASNEDEDACDHSPARAPSAITVGATDVTDTRAWFSNWGSCVDLFAPGVAVLSSWWTADDALNMISGTSMASPHVAGLVARYRQAHPRRFPGSGDGCAAGGRNPCSGHRPEGIAEPARLRGPAGRTARQGRDQEGLIGHQGKQRRVGDRTVGPTDLRWCGDDVLRHGDPQVQRRQKDRFGIVQCPEHEDHRTEEQRQVRRPGERQERGRQRPDLEDLEHRHSPLIHSPIQGARPAIPGCDFAGMRPAVSGILPSWRSMRIRLPEQPAWPALP